MKIKMTYFIFYFPLIYSVFFRCHTRTLQKNTSQYSSGDLETGVEWDSVNHPVGNPLELADVGKLQAGMVKPVVVPARQDSLRTDSKMAFFILFIFTYLLSVLILVRIIILI